MASRVAAALAGFLLSLLAMLLAVPERTSAAQLLNGGFEQGLTSWAGGGLSAAGCTPHSGTGALNLSTSASTQNVFAQQSIAGPFGAGTHTVNGFVSVVSGSPSITVAFVWRTAVGDQPARSQTLAAGSTYAAFTFNDPIPPTTATSLIVKMTVISSSAATVCFDDLSLIAPPPPPPTPIPTLTPTPTTTATPITPASTGPNATATNPQAAATSTSSGAATATRTSTPDSSQASTPANSVTPFATVAAAAGLQFVNGGFEEGLRGWLRYGGDLQTVASPARSGAGAAVLSSSTTSTKWAYQVVAIDPTKAYEFSGYLRPAAGVKAAYLRVSWYEGADGGGRAISTDDSAAKLAGANDAFAFVSTGGIAPPTTAHSARLRVMLTPDGAGSTSVYLDDFAFFLTTATRQANKTIDPDEPIETPVATNTPKPGDPTATPIAGASDATATESNAAASVTTKPSTASATSGKSSTTKATSTPKRTAVAEVRGIRSNDPSDSGSPVVENLAFDSAPPRHRGRDSRFAWIAGVLALVVSGAGAYLASKRSRQ